MQDGLGLVVEVCPRTVKESSQLSPKSYSYWIEQPFMIAASSRTSDSLVFLLSLNFFFLDPFLLARERIGEAQVFGLFHLDSDGGVFVSGSLLTGRILDDFEFVHVAAYPAESDLNCMVQRMEG